METQFVRYYYYTKNVNLNLSLKWEAQGYTFFTQINGFSSLDISIKIKPQKLFNKYSKFKMV